MKYIETFEQFVNETLSEFKKIDNRWIKNKGSVYIISDNDSEIHLNKQEYNKLKKEIVSTGFTETWFIDLSSTIYAEYDGDVISIVDEELDVEVIIKI